VGVEFEVGIWKADALSVGANRVELRNNVKQDHAAGWNS
jgi:hypothetical protein